MTKRLEKRLEHAELKQLQRGERDGRKDITIGCGLGKMEMRTRTSPEGRLDFILKTVGSSYGFLRLLLAAQ